MFTGLIQTTAKIMEIFPKGEGGVGKQIILRPFDKSFLNPDDCKIGDSISVNGACQTVEKIKGDHFQIFSIPETLKVTNLSRLKKNDIVNLEKAMRFSDRLGGHLVLGHIEEMAYVKNIEKQESFYNIDITYSSDFLIPKGSITLDGISLTIQKVLQDGFSIQIIPETIEKTNIRYWETGSLINVENDFLVKTVDHLLKKSKLNV